MEKETGGILKGGHLVIDRYHQGHYKIDTYTYDKIMELIKFYHESMYLLPDDEVIEAIGVDEGNLGKKTILRINEIVFL